MKPLRSCMTVAALLAGLGVVCGAFGAHALKGLLGAYEMSVYEKAVSYHLLHAIAALIVSVLGSLPEPQQVLPQPKARLVALMLIAGLAVFSGSLYALSMTGMRWLGAVTPIGGVLMIAAWLVLGFEIWRCGRGRAESPSL